MPKTIEVEIDAAGRLRPLAPLPPLPVRALLVLPEQESPASPTRGATAAEALKLLASPRYAKRPRSQPDEVSRRSAELRGDWDRREGWLAPTSIPAASSTWSKRCLGSAIQCVTTLRPTRTQSSTCLHSCNWKPSSNRSLTETRP